ncbi:hypothetical protein [Streptomyces sp. NPDC003697]
MIMEVLGHSSIRVTMDIYTFVRLDSQRSAFDRVGDALRGDDSDPDDDEGSAAALMLSSHLELTDQAGSARSAAVRNAITRSRDFGI